MPFVRSSSSALGLGLLFGAVVITHHLVASADDVKPVKPPTSASAPAATTAPAQTKPAQTKAAQSTTKPAATGEQANVSTEKKDAPPPKKRAATTTRESSANEKSDADLASREPPPPSTKLDARPPKLSRVKTDGTGAGEANDESDKLATLPATPGTAAPTAVSSAGPKNETDEKLRERIQTTLISDQKLPYTARMVSVQVKKGTITLSGEVNTDYERTRVSQVVDRIRGGHDMINQISVRNRSPEALQATSK